MKKKYVALFLIALCGGVLGLIFGLDVRVQDSKFVLLIILAFGYGLSKLRAHWKDEDDSF